MKEVTKSSERKLDSLSKAQHLGKRILFISVLFLMSYSLHAQSLSNLSFGTDSTLEVMTWNIEQFPKNGQSTVDSVKKILTSLDVDVYALQEIKDTSTFKQMVNSIDGYDYYVQENFLPLAYMYKTDEVEINDLYERFTSAPFNRPFPRAPVIMKMTFSGKDYVIFNNHFKAEEDGDGIIDPDDSWDDETRRLDASNKIKDYIDNTLSDKQVLVVGDLNDELTDDSVNNVFQPFLDDTANYKFADMDLAKTSAANWSYPSYPSHIDHILITNELFAEFEDNSTVTKTIRIDDYYNGGFSSYDYNVSDHRPVAIKFLKDIETGINTFQNVKGNLKNYPNPFTNRTTFSFDPVKVHSTLEIFNIHGQKVTTLQLPGGSSSASWYPGDLARGVYFAKLKAGDALIGITKIVVLD